MEEKISVLGENVLVRDVNSSPEKHGNYYVAPSSYSKVKMGVVVDVGVLSAPYPTLDIGSSIFYDTEGIRTINSKGIELKVVPQENLLALVDGKDNESN
jgi:co-chaperonin GroES (HSP10)